MKLIIDIDEETYNDIQSRDWKNGVFSEEWKAIHNGIPLDKIRAEIEQITDTMGVSYNQYLSKIDVLQIIDKYRNEVNHETDN